MSGATDDRQGHKAKYTKGSVGGLVTAIYPALQERGGIWFGWSGKTGLRQLSLSPSVHIRGNIEFMTIDLTESDIENYYSGFSNRTLWPLVHSFPTRVRMREDEYRAYRRVNRRFAEIMKPHLRDDDMVWIQDYHLIPLGANLRQLGWKGPLGFFLHTPFPPPEIFWILPWARPLLDDFMRYDLVGFHTEKFRENFESSMFIDFDGARENHCLSRGGERLHTGVYPIGINPASFRNWAGSPGALKQKNSIARNIGKRAMILGVDRLDYTKGIEERLRTFEKFLEKFPGWIRKVSLIQISSPSRTRITEYMNQKRQVEMIVGEINGRFADADWTPISYLYRSFDQESLVGFYRAADVCFVSPLRDGMNLVAKEYVASQGDTPGVLVLSRFCGAAEYLRGAIIINPYDLDGTARALKVALEMPPSEKKRRWASLMETVEKHSAKRWRDSFLDDLISRRSSSPGGAAMGIGERLLDGVILPAAETKPDDSAYRKKRPES